MISAKNLRLTFFSSLEIQLHLSKRKITTIFQIHCIRKWFQIEIIVKSTTLFVIEFWSTNLFSFFVKHVDFWGLQLYCINRTIPVFKIDNTFMKVIWKCLKMQFTRHCCCKNFWKLQRMFVILVPKVSRGKSINSGLWNSLKIPVLNRAVGRLLFFLLFTWNCKRLSQVFKNSLQSTNSTETKRELVLYSTNYKGEMNYHNISRAFGTGPMESWLLNFKPFPM